MGVDVDVENLLDRICELIAARADAERIATARRRHADVMAGRETDSLPIVFDAPLPAEVADWPSFGWDERFHDPAKSLLMQLKEMVLPRVGADCDSVPGVRADLGTINCQTVFGAEWRVTGENRSVITRYVPKAVLAEFELPDDVSDMGVIPRVIEHMTHHVEALRRRGLSNVVSVYHCDQQGPFDIAAMTRGHDLFLDLYEDGEFVHHLLEMCTRLYVSVSALCKGLCGETVSGAGNAVGVWMEGGAVRMCADSDILVSAESYREFIQPYARSALAAMGGGWLHYCGGWRGTGRAEGLHLHEAFGEIPHLRGLNWTTGRDWLAEMKSLAAVGLVHIGSAPRLEGEPLGEYFRRVLSCYEARTGLIFGLGEGPWLGDDPPERVMDTWREAQDERFG